MSYSLFFSMIGNVSQLSNAIELYFIKQFTEISARFHLVSETRRSVGTIRIVITFMPTLTLKSDPYPTLTIILTLLTFLSLLNPTKLY